MRNTIVPSLFLCVYSNALPNISDAISRPFIEGSGLDNVQHKFLHKKEIEQVLFVFLMNFFLDKQQKIIVQPKDAKKLS